MEDADGGGMGASTTRGGSGMPGASSSLGSVVGVSGARGSGTISGGTGLDKGAGGCIDIDGGMRWYRDAGEGPPKAGANAS